MHFLNLKKTFTKFLQTQWKIKRILNFAALNQQNMQRISWRNKSFRLIKFERKNHNYIWTNLLRKIYKGCELKKLLEHLDFFCAIFRHRLMKLFVRAREVLTLSCKNSKSNRDNFCVLFLNILLRNHCHVTQNMSYFQHYMKLPFENEIFQLLPVWAEICPSEKKFYWL